MLVVFFEGVVLAACACARMTVGFPVGCFAGFNYPFRSVPFRCLALRFIRLR